MKPNFLPEGSVERWAWDFISTTELDRKLRPPPAPSEWATPSQACVIVAPGRPTELRPREERRKTPKVKQVQRRAQVLSTFLHHELQAAELFAWAILAFPETPRAFRRGLLAICQDEIRHLGMYAGHLRTLGFPFGTFPVNDYFWRRVPSGPCTPAHFVARLGIAFEGANLDHGARFTQAFSDAGDAVAADIQAQIVREEVPHTAFALHWFRELTGGVDFDHWRHHLPPPISPVMARGNPLNTEARRRAGFPDDFVSALAGWDAGPAGRS